MDNRSDHDNHYLSHVGDDEDKYEDHREGEEEDKEDDTLASTVFSQRYNFREREQEHFLKIISPLDTFVGVTFAIPLTSTNVKRNTMLPTFNSYVFLLCFFQCIYNLWRYSFDIALFWHTRDYQRRRFPPLKSFIMV
jgi:hypothetical protein